MKYSRINVMRVIIMVAVIFSLTNCTKEGPAGPAGTDGTNGAVNIENFDFTVASYQWVYDDLYDIWYYRYNVEKNSSSLVYGYVMSGNGKQAMPYHEKTSYSDIEYTFATHLFGSPTYIELQYANFENPTTVPIGDTYFSLIIIPPSENKAHIDYSDYNTVLDYYHLNN